MTEDGNRRPETGGPEPGELADAEVVEAEVVEAEPAVLSAEDLGIELPDDPDEARALLLALVAEARAEAASHLDDLKRVAADFENFRRRAAREQSETTQRAAERFLLELLPVLDTFDAALAIETSSEAEEKLLAGMRRTHEQLLSILDAHGLEIVASVGEEFDPEVHEPVMTAEGEGRLIVDQELRRGYRLKDRLVRPALVSLERES